MKFEKGTTEIGNPDLEDLPMWELFPDYDAESWADKMEFEAYGDDFDEDTIYGEED